MKITDIKTFLMHVGAPNLKKWASDGSFGTETFSKNLTGTRNWLFVKVYTDEGITGIGECSGWPRVIETAVQDLKRLLIGEDPTHIELLWQKMHIAIMGHGMTGTVGAGAMTGIDMALWDIKGKTLGVPVWNLLGGKVRDRVRIYAHAKTPEAALSLKERGITAIKAGGVSDPVRMIDALREAVGDDMDIDDRPAWPALADARRRRAGVPGAGAIQHDVGRGPDRAREPRGLQAHPRRIPACRWRRASGRPRSSACAS